MTESKRSEKHEEARNSLAVELRPIFDDLVEEYKYRTVVRLGSSFVSYVILADLVRAGWRHSAEAIGE